MSQNGTQTTARPDPGVRPKAQHRQFKAEYKKRILDEADACTTPPQRGALVRRESLYSSHLTAWRRQRARGILDGLAPKKRGVKPDPLALDNALLRIEIDDLTQRLAVVAIDMGRLEQDVTGQPELVPEKLRDMKNQVLKVSEDVHSISRQLHPSILDDLGLVRAAGSECERFSSREGIDVAFTEENLPSNIPIHISLSLYRIVQEGLRNIAKHACATHTSVSRRAAMMPWCSRFRTTASASIGKRQGGRPAWGSRA